MRIATLPTLVAAALACAAPPPLPEAESPSGPLRAAIVRSEAKLFASDYAKSGAGARRATEDYLAGLVGAAWQLAESATLVAEPALHTDDGVLGRPGLFNPDNRYASALPERGGRYVIRGRRGTHTQLILQVLDAYPLLALGQNRLVMDTDALGIQPGEDFEIFLGGESQGARWFPLADDARALIVRSTFSDWEHETPSELWIERLDDSLPASSASCRRSRASSWPRTRRCS